MKTAQAGDRVRVHYVKHFADGSFTTSRVAGPIELTIGVDHPRLPGLGMALVGMSPGTRTTLVVPPEHAYGLSDPKRRRRLPRERFAKGQQLEVGKWLRITGRDGRCRQVRVLEICDESTVLVDTNHRGAGQTMELRVKLLGIQQPLDASADSQAS